MKKIIEILSTFTEEEIRQFDLFLQSPVYNTKKRLSEFYQAIIADFPCFEQISREVVFYRINPSKKTYSERSIRNLKKELTKKIMIFFVFVEQQADYRNRDLYLLESTMRRGLPDMFEKEIDRVRKSQKEETIHEFDYLFYQFKIEDIAYRYKSIYHNRDMGFSKKAPTQFLDYYYLLHKLRYSLAALQRQHVLSITQEIQMMDEVMSFLKNNR